MIERPRRVGARRAGREGAGDEGAEEPVDIARSENIAATVEPTEPIADAAGTPPEQ